MTQNLLVAGRLSSEGAKDVKSFSGSTSTRTTATTDSVTNSSMSSIANSFSASKSKHGTGTVVSSPL